MTAQGFIEGGKRVNVIKPREYQKHDDGGMATKTIESWITDKKTESGDAGDTVRKFSTTGHLTIESRKR